MDNTGTVDFGDFFLFVDNFGKTVSGKRWASNDQQDATTRFVLLAHEEQSAAVVQLQAKHVEDLQAFGLLLQYNPELVEFSGLRGGDLLERGGDAPLLQVLSASRGQVIVGNGLVDGARVSGAGLLAQLVFHVTGDPAELTFAPSAFISRGTGDVQRVSSLAPARLIPQTYRLGANYPNPFNPSTSIDYTLPADSRVRLTIFDILGRPIRVLVDEHLQRAGYHRARWDGRTSVGHGVARGVYFYALEAGSFRQTRRMVLVK